MACSAEAPLMNKWGSGKRGKGVTCADLHQKFFPRVDSHIFPEEYIMIIVEVFC